MKKIFRMALVFALAGATLMYTGCSKDYGEDIDRLDSKLTSVQTDLTNKLSDLEGRLSTLQSGVTALDAAYKAADNALTSKISALDGAYKAADDAIKADIKALQDRCAAIEDAIKDLDKLATKEELKDVKEALEQKIANDLAALKTELLATAEGLQNQIDAINAALLLKADAKDVYTKAEVDAFLTKYYTQEEINAFLDKKADKDAVYTKEEILGFLAEVKDMFKAYYTKAELEEILKGYVSQEQAAEFLAQLAEALDKKADKDAVYTKAEITEMLSAYYTAAQIDEIFEKYYTAAQIDETLKNYFTKKEVETLLADYYTAAQVDELLAKKADADKVYTKTEIDEFLAKYYTAAEIDEMFTKYYTSAQVDELFTKYYTIEEVDALFTNYYTIEQVDALFKDLNDKLNKVFEILSNELRSIVFMPDFYFAGIEATSYDFGKFFNYEIVALEKDQTFFAEEAEAEEATQDDEAVKYTLLKGSKTTAKVVVDKKGAAVINTQGQVGKANYDLNPSTFPTDSANWSLNGDNKKYVVKADEKTWFPVFEGIEKDADGLATVTYSIANPEYLESSVIGAFPFIYDPKLYNIKDADNGIVRYLFWAALQEDLLNYNNGRSKANNVAIMQLEANIKGTDRAIVSDWHAVTSFEELVAHLAFADDNKYETYVEDDCGLANPMTKDLYEKAKDAVLNPTNLKIKWNGGPVDLAKLIAIHTKDAEDLSSLESYTLEEFNAKYPGYHFEFEPVPYTIGKNDTSEDMYGKIEGTEFTPCYVKSVDGKPTSVVIPEDSVDGMSSVGRLPVVLVTLVSDEDDSIKAYGWFKIEISKDVKEPLEFIIPNDGNVPYICGEFNLTTSWHEFSYFVLEGLKVDYKVFVRNYDFVDICVKLGDKYVSLVSANDKPVYDGVYYKLSYVDPATKKTVKLGRAMYEMDASGGGINDAFSWLVDPIGIGEGKSNEIWFKFFNESDDQDVYVKISATVADRAKMDLGKKIAKEWYDDVTDSTPINTARMNVHVPNADEINPNVIPNAKGGDVLDYTRSLQHYFQDYIPQFTLSSDADEVYKNFFNTEKGVDPDAGDNNDRYDDPELNVNYDFFFSKEQPKIGNFQLYSNWWGPGEEVVTWYETESVLVKEAWDERVFVPARPWGYWMTIHHPAVYEDQEVEHSKTITYATGKLIYVAADMNHDGKDDMMEVTVDGKKYNVPVAYPDHFIAYIQPTTTEIFNKKEYRADVLQYIPTLYAKILLNLYRHDATAQGEMLYANVYVKSAYGNCGIDLEDNTFHVRFLRPLDVNFEDVEVAEESAVDGWNVELPEFIAGIVDWNGQDVIVKEMVKDEKGNDVWTGYYVPNVIKGVDMYKYYVFQKLVIDLANTQVNNVDPADPEKFFKLSEKIPGARLAIGTVQWIDAEGNLIPKKDWVFTEGGDGITVSEAGEVTIPMADISALRGIVLNYRNDEGYSDPFTLKIKVSVKYAWGVLDSDYLYIKVGETTDHNVE